MFDACCAGCASGSGKHYSQCTQHKQKRLYHITSRDAAAMIREGGKFIRGSRGKFGPGIYFCDNEAHCKQKALASKPWALVTADVRLGNMLTVSNLGNQTYTDLATKGYDSVYAPGSVAGGIPEYVVYSWNQINIVKINDV